MVMSNILFFDTETSGLLNGKNESPATDLKVWDSARLVQLCMIQTTSDGTEIDRADFIIKPDGFVISDGAAAIHGISQEKALQDGTDLSIVLEKAKQLIESSEVLIAHNALFDTGVVNSTFFRANGTTPLTGKRIRCTMKPATGYCGAKNRFGGAKWPSLAELHTKLFNEGFDGAHNAIADTEACKRIYFGLIKEGVLH